MAAEPMLAASNETSSRSRPMTDSWQIGRELVRFSGCSSSRFAPLETGREHTDDGVRDAVEPQATSDDIDPRRRRGARTHRRPSPRGVAALPIVVMPEVASERRRDAQDGQNSAITRTPRTTWTPSSMLTDTIPPLSLPALPSSWPARASPGVGSDAENSGHPLAGLLSKMRNGRSSAANGRAQHRIDDEKMAAFTPMPRASVSVAINVNAGRILSARAA